MSARDRVIITLAIAAFACVVGYWVLVRPSTRHLVAAKRSLAQLQDQREAIVRLRGVRVQDVMHTAGMWTAEESSMFLQRLARLATTHGARLVNVSVADPRRVNPAQQGGESTIDYGLFEMKVTARFQGVYPAIRRLLAALHDHQPRLQLTTVGLAPGQLGDEIEADTDIVFFVFQRAVGNRPVGPTPTATAAPDTVAVAGPHASPFGRALATAEAEAEEAEAGVSPAVAVPPDLPDVGAASAAEDVSEDEQAAPEGPRPVLAGVVGRKGSLLAAISVEGRTRLYAAGDKLSENATLAVVRAEGVQITVHRDGARAPEQEAERNIIVRTGQPISGVELGITDGHASPDAGPLGGPNAAFPVSAGTVSGPAGVLGLVREEDSTYVVRPGDVIAGTLQVVAIRDGDVYVSDADAGVRRTDEPVALPHGGR